jgi:hypothetical protein
MERGPRASGRGGLSTSIHHRCERVDAWPGLRSCEYDDQALLPHTWGNCRYVQMRAYVRRLQMTPNGPDGPTTAKGGPFEASFQLYARQDSNL